MKLTTPRQACKGFYDIEKDGLTQGLLGKFADCRFMALWFLKGFSLKSPSLPLTYGSVAHGTLEYAYEDVRTKKLKSLPSKKETLKYIQRVEKEWRIENPRADKKSLEFLELSLLIAEATLPTYFEYWHKDVKNMVWEKIEGDFAVPYKLADGRKTLLRGKMDGVYTNPKRWLFETKTKSRIEESNLVDVLPFELQVNLYLKALRMLGGALPRGVLYNLIRRTGLQRGKKESLPQYAKRCAADIIKRPEWYFIRLEVSIGPDDTKKFDAELDAMIKDFYDWFDGVSGHWKNSGACETKYGRCDYLSAENNVMAPYEKRKQVFKELEEK